MLKNLTYGTGLEGIKMWMVERHGKFRNTRFSLYIMLFSPKSSPKSIVNHAKKFFSYTYREGEGEA